MIVDLSADILYRLADIRETEGVPPEDVVRQAVEVFSHLTAEERRILVFAAMQLVVARHRRDR